MCRSISRAFDCPGSRRIRFVSRGAVQAAKAIWTTGRPHLLLAIAYITRMYGQIKSYGMWLFRLAPKNPDDVDGLMTARAYSESVGE
jgi:hypothetical protein